jgi:hypothetical protein
MGHRDEGVEQKKGSISSNSGLLLSNSPGRAALGGALSTGLGW